MEKSKLIDILIKFNPSEIERLKAFMVSPYFIKQKTLVDFAQMVLNEYPHFQGDKVSEKNIYAEVFPGQKFQQQTISDLMTLMISTIHRFLAVENFLLDDTGEKLRLMAELRTRRMGKEFLRIGAKLHKKLETGKKDHEYFLHLMEYENELDQYFFITKEHLGYSQYLQNKSDAFDLYYMASKLKLASHMINKQNVFSSDYDLTLLNEVVEYVRTHIEKYENIPAVNIYYRVILTLIKPEEEDHFHILKVLLEQNTDNFTSQEIREMYHFAQNYCIKKANSGRREYLAELFKLYRKLLDTGIIYENSYISQWDYKNITSVGLRLNEYDWIENFIQSNRNRIHPDFKDIAYNYNLANLYYEKKEFKAALRTLNEFNRALKLISDPDFDDTFYNLDSRSMLLKIYYQLEEEDPFRAMIESFKLFLTRNKKLSDNQRLIYLNLLKYTKKLNDERQKHQFNPGKGRPSFMALKNKINTEKNIVNLTWLQSQVEKLEKQFR